MQRIATNDPTLARGAARQMLAVGGRAVSRTVAKENARTGKVNNYKCLIRGWGEHVVLDECTRPAGDRARYTVAAVLPVPDGYQCNVAVCAPVLRLRGHTGTMLAHVSPHAAARLLQRTVHAAHAAAVRDALAPFVRVLARLYEAEILGLPGHKEFLSKFDALDAAGLSTRVQMLSQRGGLLGTRKPGEVFTARTWIDASQYQGKQCAAMAGAPDAVLILVDVEGSPE